MSSEALEQALALHRTPIQRFALRGRPLPADIGSVIQLASGNENLLRETAERVCEAETTLLDAARFYLQQVLFEPDADAYRTLGIDRETSAERTREHYRWLQGWLHPDRLGEEWEAVYSTRVNWAWNHLRSEAARRAYDLELQAAEPAEVPRTETAVPMTSGEWHATPVEHAPISWRNRVILGASLGSCLLLLLVAVIREEPAPNAWVSTQPPADHLSLPAGEPVTHSPPAATVAQAIARVMPNAGRGSAPPDSAHADAPTGGHPTDALAAQRSAQELATIEPESAEHPVAVSLAAEQAALAPRADPTDTPPRHIAEARTDAARPTTTLATAAAPDSRVPQIPESLGSPAAPPSASLERVAHRSVPMVTPKPAARPAPAAMAPVDRPAAVEPAVAQVAEANATNVTALADAMREIGAADALVAPASAPVARPGIVQVARFEQAPPEPEPATRVKLGSEELLARVSQARARVTDIVAYFRSSGSGAVGWPDEMSRSRVQHVRAELRHRNGIHNATQFALDTPNWRLSGNRAALDTTYHLDRGQSESGRLVLTMTWHGEAWRLTRLELHPTQ